ncbi:MAG: preprotein translocase subunit SecG [Pseudomonadota bacterium]
MENVVLIIHLLLALGLIAVVLLQRSEGGGLGIGGGGGAQAGRPPATALGKLTWVLGVGFLITSITLTIIVAQQSAGASVIDRLSDVPAPRSQDATSSGEVDGESLLPPADDSSAPLVPSAD